MTRLLVSLLAALLMVVIAAFFAYVALVPTLIASLILLALALMFGLGLYVGNESEPGVITVPIGKSFRRNLRIL